MLHERRRYVNIINSLLEMKYMLRIYKFSEVIKLLKVFDIVTLKMPYGLRGLKCSRRVWPMSNGNFPFFHKTESKMECKIRIKMHFYFNARYGAMPQF